jgi:hypothetical protein
MIFVDTIGGEARDVEQFAYTNQTGLIEYAEASKQESTVILFDVDKERVSEIYYEDIPKLILALQAAYDFKFKDSQ